MKQVEHLFEKSTLVNSPTKLYHYTSLDKLALILQTQKIRFSELSMLNDLEEQNVQFSQRDSGWTKAYVSCWTEECEESIPMWKMYSEIPSGIRICLPQNPFKNYISFVSIKDGSMMINSLSSIKHIKLQNNSFQEPDLKLLSINNSLIKVEYSDNFSTKDIIASCWNGDLGVTFPMALGRLKRTAWSFEKEWRYIAYLLTRNKDVIIPPYCDFELRKDALKKIEIVKSPMFTKANEILLDSLIDKFQIDPKRIKQSLLTGNVRL